MKNLLSPTPYIIASKKRKKEILNIEQGILNVEVAQPSVFRIPCSIFIIPFTYLDLLPFFKKQGKFQLALPIFFKKQGKCHLEVRLFLEIHRYLQVEVRQFSKKLPYFSRCFSVSYVFGGKKGFFFNIYFASGAI
jgi:hypothetical protein